jgi:archaellum component FlaC
MQECKYEETIKDLQMKDTEQRIIQQHQNERLDKLDEKLDKIDGKLDDFISEMKNGYIPKRTIETLKQENELMEKIVGDIIYKKVGRWVIALISTNIITLIAFLYTIFGG